ncbi:hypothetical protein PR048_031279 [Dryococelus australis]|uniref:Uncharacterized protein n=1 Tax=Dryococelus australis TaxID=614101 RepID=A0ABQ9G7P8_9NEOP|nr:hypothetical protein PR048_031279 [Dryococelus australis]
MNEQFFNFNICKIVACSLSFSAVSIYMDIINIFIRVAMILAGGNRRQSKLFLQELCGQYYVLNACAGVEYLTIIFVKEKHYFELINFKYG